MAIGAIKFDPFKPKAGYEQFFQPIDLFSCQAHGLKVDAERVMWVTSIPSTLEIFNQRRIVDLATGLYGFSDWYGKESVPTWSASSGELENLRRAYYAIGDQEPWSLAHERDTRTIEALVDTVSVNGKSEIDPLLVGAAVKAGYIQAVVKKLGLTRL